MMPLICGIKKIQQTSDTIEKKKAYGDREETNGDQLGGVERTIE